LSELKPKKPTTVATEAGISQVPESASDDVAKYLSRQADGGEAFLPPRSKITSEMEAIIPEGSTLAKRSDDYFLKYGGERVPINRYELISKESVEEGVKTFSVKDVADEVYELSRSYKLGEPTTFAPTPTLTTSASRGVGTREMTPSEDFRRNTPSNKGTKATSSPKDISSDYRSSTKSSLSSARSSGYSTMSASYSGLLSSEKTETSPISSVEEASEVFEPVSEFGGYDSIKQKKIQKKFGRLVEKYEPIEDYEKSPPIPLGEGETKNGKDDSIWGITSGKKIYKGPLAVVLGSGSGKKSSKNKKDKGGSVFDF